MTTVIPTAPGRARVSAGTVRTALREARDTTGRWPFLDGARGLAILAVFGFHALRVAGDWHTPKIREGVPPALWVMGTARFSIDMFFVLSGFLVTWTWWRRRERHGRLGPALRDYVRTRALRILPVFWLALLVLIPLRAPEVLTSPRDLALLISVQQYLDPDLPGRVNTVLWSLTTEVHFYILLPLLAVVVRRRLPALAALAGAVALSVWWFEARDTRPASVILGRLDQFIAGMGVALLYGRHLAGHRSALIRVARARGVGWVLGAIILAVGVYHGSTLGLPRGHPFDGWQHPVVGLALAGLGLRLLCSERPGLLRRVLERPTLLVLGAMSYSLYLWHLPLLEASFDLLQPFTAGVPVLGTALGVAVALGASVVAGALSYAYVEAPFIRRKARGVSDGPAAPSPGTVAAPAAAGR